MGIQIRLDRVPESWLESWFCHLPASLSQLDEQADSHLDLDHGIWQMALELLHGEAPTHPAADLVLGGHLAPAELGEEPVAILLASDVVVVAAYLNERRAAGYDARARESFEQGCRHEHAETSPSVLPSLTRTLDELIAFYEAAAAAGEFVLTATR